VSDFAPTFPEQAPWRDALLFILLAPALIAGCYSSAFLEYDDSAHYTHPQVLLTYPLKDVWKPTTETYFPVTVLSYRIDRALFESSPPATIRRSKAAPGVRLHSLLLHVLAGIFLWRALLLLKLGRWMSLFGAAVWTLHPAACESVCWISERKNILAAFGGFASLWVYFGGIRKPLPRAGVTAVLFVLAMLSKPNAAGFFPIYVMYDLATAWMNRSERSKSPFHISMIRALPNALLYGACVGVIAFLAQLNLRMCETSTVARAGGSLWTVALTDVPILTHYIFNALIPSSLSIFYYSPIVTSLTSGFFWTHSLILVALVSGTVWVSPNRARTIFLWLWFFGALGPALNIIPIPYLMQDRYAYFALPALLVIAGETVVALFYVVKKQQVNAAATSDSYRKFGATATIIAAVCVAIMAALRSSVYANDFELQRDAVLKQPLSAYAHLHYVLTLTHTADISEYSGHADAATLVATRQEALKHILICQQCPDFDRMLDPGRVKIVMAVQYERLGQPDAAYDILIAELKQPQKAYNVTIACASLTRIELLRDRPDAGLKWLESAVKYSLDQTLSPELLFLKGMCLEKLNRITEAQAAYSTIPANSLAFERAQERLKSMAR